MSETPDLTGEGEALLNRQRALEARMLTEGAKRFRRRLEEAVREEEASTFGAGIKLLAHAVPKVQEALDALLADTAKRGPKHLGLKWAQKVGTETAAFITCRVVIDGIMSHQSLPDVAHSVSGLILDELRFRRFQEKRPQLFEYKIARLPGTNYRHNKKVLEQSIRWAVDNPRDNDEPLDLNDLYLTDQQRLYVGAKLIDVFIAATGLASIETRTVNHTKQGKHVSRLLIRPTAETLEWVGKRNALLEFQTPVNLPMVVPPLPWGPGQEGGYRYAMRGRARFVRQPYGRRQQAFPTPPAEMPLVYAAVNAIQDTPWTINRDVLALVYEIKRRGKPLAGLPSHEKIPLPKKPADIADNPEARRRWKLKAKMVHEANQARAVRATELAKTLLAVEAVKNDAVIYFPCSVDFRGRVYPIPNYLNPQGDDLSKALLKFADAKPLGEDGAFWLAIHGANCLDETPEGEKVKTMTHAERASWIQRNTQRICDVVTDPFADLWWTEADEPLQFYAFCVEWRGFYLEWLQGRGEEYVCGLPVSQDGSCNGLQHFSAMLRDPIGGRATNLTANERPQDVYQAVCDNVSVAVQADLAGDDPVAAAMATRWIKSGLIKRKLCKRPTMTFGYGSKLFGMRNQTVELLEGEYAAESRTYFTTDDGDSLVPDAALYIARHIWSALASTVVKAAEGMKWMQDCARMIATQNKPVYWTVPVTGFRVQQEYWVPQVRQIRTILAGQVIKPAVYEPTGDVLLHRQINAVAPNVIHSLDAACLMLTVVRARQQGVTSFGMIHDSYATVPADCGTLAKITREAFVEFYSQHDVAAHIAACFSEQVCDLEKPLPNPPAPGTLDITEVLRSDYFFS